MIVVHLLAQRFPGVNKPARLDEDRQLVIEALDRLLQFKRLAEGELVLLRVCAVQPDQREPLGKENHGQVEILRPKVAIIVVTECRRKSVHKSHKFCCQLFLNFDLFDSF
jgi:hypothetical protein